MKREDAFRAFVRGSSAALKKRILRTVLQEVIVDTTDDPELALVCEDPSIVSVLNRLGYRTGNGNTWTAKRVQHVRHTNGFPPVRRQTSGCVDHHAASRCCARC